MKYLKCILKALLLMLIITVLAIWVGYSSSWVMGYVYTLVTPVLIISYMLVGFYFLDKMEKSLFPLVNNDQK